jgi:hypothetical protein
MRWLGIWLVVFGVLNFVLPRIGYDLKWFELLGDKRDLVGGGLLVLGVVLVLLGRKKKKE